MDSGGGIMDEKYYAEYDDETGFWCVIEKETEKARESYCDKEIADERVKKLNEAE
jgi:hypothetical protein